MEIKTVGVLGCGLMGSGIAQVSAAAGYRTIVREVDDGFLQKGLGRIRKFLDDGVAKGKVTAEARDKTLAALTGTTRLDDLRDCDLVIEAIVENLEEKRIDLRGGRAGGAGPHDPPLEYIVAVHHRARRLDWPSRSLRAGCTSSIRCR